MGVDLEIGDILERVGRTEGDRSGYKEAAEVWENMWKMKVFARSTAEAIQRDGQEQVTLPTTFNIVNLAQRLISTTPKIDVPPLEVSAEADEGAQKCEQWLTAMWQQANRQQQRNLIADATWWTLVRGRNCFEVKWIKDKLPSSLRKRRLPILIRTLDPLNVGVKRGSLYTHWAYHKYTEERLEAAARFPELKLMEKKRIDKDYADEVTIIDYWYRDYDDGSVWNAIIVDEKYAKEPVKTLYPEIPIIESFGDTSPLDDETWKGMSILHALRDLYPYSCRLASQLATGMLWYFWPPITVQHEQGQPISKIHVQPGETTTVPWGTKIDIHQISPNVPLAQAMMEKIDSAIQQSTFPQVMYGDAGNMQAGFGVSLLSDAAKGRVKSVLENLEFAIAQVNEQVLGLVAARGGKDGVDVWGMDAGSDKPYRLSLSKKEIADYRETTVSLKPQVPQDDMAKQTLALRFIEAKVMSRRTVQDKMIGMVLPSDETARIELEDAMLSDPMKPYVAAAAMRKYFGPDWGQMINVGQPPPPPFGPPINQGPAQGGPPGPGGPQMGPPPNMPMPQGPPPPPPPPQMIGPPPPAMMPPPQGLPPGVTPELIAQVIQMLQQQGGPPPPMPPEMMGQGGPPPMGGPGIPPGQSPQMMQPPMGGGVPPEMQGQLTPEMLGMGSTSDPLTFAGVTGQQIPPADELKILAGHRNVGNKTEKKGRK